MVLTASNYEIYVELSWSGISSKYYVRSKKHNCKADAALRVEFLYRGLYRLIRGRLTGG